MALTNKHKDDGYLGQAPKSKTYDTMVINGFAHRVHTVTVHMFAMGDVEDPDLYAAEPLIGWQNSDEGRWVMAHAVETPMWHRVVDYNSFGFKYAITAKLKGRDYTYWQIKWKKLTT